MEYKICKLQFSTGLHIGKGMLTDGEPIFMADTFFSALCHEALGISEGIEKLVHYCKSGKLKLSDGLPYIDDNCIFSSDAEKSVISFFNDLIFDSVTGCPQFYQCFCDCFIDCFC